MLSPRQLDGLSDEIVEIYSQLETDILRDMARRLARLGKVTEATEWQAHVLAEAGGLQEHIRKTFKKYDAKTVQAVTAVYKEALEKNTANDNRIFKVATWLDEISSAAYTSPGCFKDFIIFAALFHPVLFLFL